MSTIASERPVLAGRPSAGIELPELHAELLALVEGHVQLTENPLPWALLLRYADILAFDGPPGLILDDSLQHRNPERLIAELIGDLSDYGLLQVGRFGLIVTESGSKALSQSEHNNVFNTMTKWLESLAGRFSDLSPV